MYVCIYILMTAAKLPIFSFWITAYDTVNRLHANVHL